MFQKIIPILFVSIIAGSAAFAGESYGINRGDKQVSIVMEPVIGKGGSPDRVLKGFQTALKEHKIRILFKGRPLADAEVTVFTKSGWKKRLRTNAAGEVDLIPIVTSNSNENDAYSVSYNHPANGARYVSDNSICFANPPPEWAKKAGSFIVWVLAVSGLIVAGIGMTFYRAMKREKRGMLAFEKYKVGKI